jgi:hypothetical protein
VRTLGDREGLPVGLGLEGQQADTRRLDLDGPQALLAQPLAVRSHLVSRRSGRGCHVRAPETLHVTYHGSAVEAGATSLAPRRINPHLIAQKCDRSVHSGGFGRRINRLRGGAGAKAAVRRALAKMRVVEAISCFQ